MCKVGRCPVNIHWGGGVEGGGYGDSFKDLQG